MITLTTPVKELKGVGPSKAAALKRLGIVTVDDLLHHYPSGYYFAPPCTDGPLVDGQPATVSGLVHSVRCFNHNFEVVLDTGVRIMWFGGQYLRQSIFKGSGLMVSGVVTNGGFTNPEWKVFKEWESPCEFDLNTVTYPITSGITSKDIRRLVCQVFAGLSFGDVHLRVKWIHLPYTEGELKNARYHLKRDELFYMQLGLAVRQARRESVPPNVCIAGCPAPIAKYFPFTFTDDQADAIHDIYQDLHGPKAMNRLLQGDVGCGKTAVAAYAAIVTAFNGAQTAILCPTEILARQHYETIKGYFEKAGVRCSLCVSGEKPDTRDPGTHDPIYQAEIVVGTTALLSERATFRNLGLVVIDEQHKFGVEQRAALRRHGNPHVLVMTATPIPRTIAMTVFGDLDISTIRSMLPGRVPVMTKWCNEYGSQLDARLCMERELSVGHQIYVVCPRIEALDDEMRAVEEVAGEYTKLFYGVGVAALHGKLNPADKKTIADDFKDNRFAILVSTTVVEVGVDNPNATVMVVEDAERFGLAQLHQLRGRVGRGKDQSYCFLLSDTDSIEAKNRLRAMENTNDGFEIAEQDLKQRGPGDLLSTRQHGLPDLKIADLVEDYDLLVKARKEARELVAKGPLPAYIQEKLERRFGTNLYLGDAA